MWLTRATNKNMKEFDIFFPSFDCFIWPIIQLMKSRGEELTKIQILEEVQSSSHLNLPERELSRKEKKELKYRAERAFDLLLVAEIIEEKLGNLYGLTNGALLISEEEARNLPRRVRTLDKYFNHDDNEDAQIDNSEVIASQTIDALANDSLNEYELKEKLVKDFASRKEVKKNLNVVDHYVDKVDYVKRVLESKDIVEEGKDGNIGLCKKPIEARKMMDKHYSHSAWHRIKSWFQNFTESLREKKVEDTRKCIARNVLLEIGLFASVVGISWLCVKGLRKKGR